MLAVILTVDAQISVTPNTGMADQLFSVTITGTGTDFMQGTTTCIEFSRGNTTYKLTDVEVDSETSLTGNLETPANAPVGAYNVKVYVGPNCEGTEWDCSDCFTIVDCDLSAAGQGTDISCHGLTDGSATANVSGGTSPYTISWSNGMTGASISDLGAGSYDFTVEDAAGCTVGGSVSISEPDALTAMISSDMMVSCFGGQDGALDLTVTGGTGDKTFMWDSGAGNVEDPTDLAAGTYMVVVMDANGCTTSTEGIITQSDSIELVVTSTDVTGEGQSDGTAAAMAVGGTGTYTYSWNNGSMDAAIDGLAAGDYEVTVTDGNGCVKVGMVTVNGFDCALMVSSAVVQIVCAGDTSGTITYTLEGASDMIGWEESELGAFDGTLSNLGAGIYEVTVMDSSNGCAVTIIDTIAQPDSIIITIDSIAGDQGQSLGSIQTTVSGGSGVLTFEWLQNGNLVGVQEDLESVAAGTYVLKVNDENGCQVLSDSLVIEATTSVLEHYFAGSVRFFPNPTHGTLQLQVTDPALEIDDEISFYDLSGRRVASENFNASKIDLNHLLPGIYFAEIGINGKKYYSKLMRL